jgi:hypothetical protein
MQEFAVRPRPPASVVTRSAPAVQRCGDHPCPPSGCNKEEEQRLARSAVGPAPSMAPPIVHEVIGSPGEPLPASLNEGMSALFGHDFARVRVHTGARAAESAASVAARAYTVGPHVVLGRSAPDLRSAAGQQLLAHELTHVIQQPAATPAGDLPVSSPGDPGEREAAAAATRAVPSSTPSSTRPSVQRDSASNTAVLWRQVAQDDQEEEDRRARSSDVGQAADAPAPAPPQDAGPAPPQDAGTAAPPQDAGVGAAPAPAPAPPAAANPPAAASGQAPAARGPAACPEPPEQIRLVEVCGGPVAAKPPRTEKAVLPTVTTANFGGDADRARFAADLARCWAERKVKQEIENRFTSDVAEAKKRAIKEAAADTEAAVKAATEGVAPGDKAALQKARTNATKAAKAAATKKIAAAQAAVTRQDPATVVAVLANANRDWLEKDYTDTMESALQVWGQPGQKWLNRMQAALNNQRAAITRAKTAKPKVKKGEQPPPAKSADEIDAEIEAEMADVRCAQRGWALNQIEGIARAWAVGRREQVDFETITQKTAELPTGFGPSYDPAKADLVPIPASLKRDKDATDIAPELAVFLTELQRVLAAANPPQTFNAGNYGGHGSRGFAGGKQFSFVDKHFSADLYLTPEDHPRDLDKRGFYPYAKAVSFLLTLDRVAASMKANWLVIYNDFSVAQEVNERTGTRHVIFVGHRDKEGKPNWHGPDPLILHFHLDLDIPKGTQAPGPAPAAAP